MTKAEVYEILQELIDLGLVQAHVVGETVVYDLTDAGRIVATEESEDDLS